MSENPPFHMGACVYVVTSDFYPDEESEASTTVERVFNDKDKAEDFAEKRNKQTSADTLYYVTVFPIE